MNLDTSHVPFCIMTMRVLLSCTHVNDCIMGFHYNTLKIRTVFLLCCGSITETDFKLEAVTSDTAIGHIRKSLCLCFFPAIYYPIMAMSPELVLTSYLLL